MSKLFGDISLILLALVFLTLLLTCVWHAWNNDRLDILKKCVWTLFIITTPIGFIFYFLFETFNLKNGINS